MEQPPLTGFPENPDKKTRLEQVKILIERHNFLVDQVVILEQEFTKKEQEIEKFDKEIREDLEKQKKELEENKQLIRNLELTKKNISGEFKQIVKTPLFNKLEKRIDGLGYENYIYRDELMRKLKK